MVMTNVNINREKAKALLLSLDNTKRTRTKCIFNLSRIFYNDYTINHNIEYAFVIRHLYSTSLEKLRLMDRLTYVIMNIYVLIHRQKNNKNNNYWINLHTYRPSSFKTL